MAYGSLLINNNPTALGEGLNLFDSEHAGAYASCLGCGCRGRIQLPFHLDRVGPPANARGNKVEAVGTEGAVDQLYETAFDHVRRREVVACWVHDGVPQVGAQQLEPLIVIHPAIIVRVSVGVRGRSPIAFSWGPIVPVYH